MTSCIAMLNEIHGEPISYNVRVYKYIVSGSRSVIDVTGSEVCSTTLSKKLKMLLEFIM